MPEYTKNPHPVWNTLRWLTIVSGVAIVFYKSGTVGVVIALFLFGIPWFGLTTIGFWLIGFVFPFWGYANVLKLRFLSQQPRFRTSVYTKPSHAGEVERKYVATQFATMRRTGEHLIALATSSQQKDDLRQDLKNLLLQMEEAQHIARSNGKAKDQALFTESIDYINQEMAALESERFENITETETVSSFDNFKGRAVIIWRGDEVQTMRLSLPELGAYQIELETGTSREAIRTHTTTIKNKTQEISFSLEGVPANSEIIITRDSGEREKILL